MADNRFQDQVWLAGALQRNREGRRRLRDLNLINEDEFEADNFTPIDARLGFAYGQDMGEDPGEHDNVARDRRLMGLLEGLLEITNRVHQLVNDAAWQEATEAALDPNVESRPRPATPETIAALPRTTATEIKDQKIDADCLICLGPHEDDEALIQLPCDHAYHEKCVVSWLEQHNTCPKCRSVVEDDGKGDRGQTETAGVDETTPTTQMADEGAGALSNE